MRQAVVIIHGIGEQRPMQTLRAFVAGVLGEGESDLKKRIFSASRTGFPTRWNSGAFACGSDQRAETDFYELYWQHLMEGTTSRPVLEWALYLLLHPNKLNRRLRVWGVVEIMAAVVIASTVALLVWEPWLAVGLTITVPALWIGQMFLKWLAAGQVERFVVGFAGDAFGRLALGASNYSCCGDVRCLDCDRRGRPGGSHRTRSRPRQDHGEGREWHTRHSQLIETLKGWGVLRGGISVQ